MKKTMLLIITGILFSWTATAQSVGINSATPNASAILDIQSKTKGLLIPRMLYAERNLIASPAIGLLIYQTNISPGYYYYNGSSWQQLASGGTNNWTLNGSDIYNNNAGYVGIGTTAPINKLQIGNPPGYSGNDIAIGNGTQGMSFFQSTTSSIWYTNTDFSLMPYGGTGYVGIQCFNPTNKLQIGAGLASIVNYDLVIGDGTDALAVDVNQFGTSFSSTNNMVFFPKNNGVHGGVGINTFNPRAPLDVVNFEAISTFNTAGYTFINLGSYQDGRPGYCFLCNAPVSIYASNAVYAIEFDAYSDARIKNIVGISSTAKDLETVNALQVTDYTMKDIVKYGNKPFKKVIAQEVEKVYPQVISTHADFIPNVYQLTDKVTQTNDGCLLHFASKHTISSTAKKLRVLLDDTAGMQELTIIAIPSANEVVIDVKEIKSGKVFVYGEEVADFRTVDYEGLSTLNISATQELSKLEKKQQNQIKQLEKRLAILENRLSVSPLPLR